jgi:mono/diheme cytochrome c family protein
MKRVAVALALFGALSGPTRADAEDRVARGRYLTHDVAMCVQCHTPRREDGSLVTEQEFMGGAFPVAAPPFVQGSQWCLTAPRIAGLPQFHGDEAVRFLMNGARIPDRPAPRSPMPPFRMNQEDAEAVVAYLRSLAASGPSSGPPSTVGTSYNR